MNRRRFLQHTAMLAMISHPAPAKLARFAHHQSEHFWQEIRAQFPLRDARIYVNTGGLGPSPLPVLNTLAQKTRELEETGETGHEIFDKAREHVAALVGATPEEIAFTRNATEGMNIIARGVPLLPDDEVLTTFHEHPGGAMPWIAATRDAGAAIRLIELPGHPAELVAHVQQNLTAKTRVFMMSHIPCTTGSIYPVGELCGLLRSRGVISVMDGAQAAGMSPIALHAMGCDFYTTSGHKWLLGPKESGFVYIAKDTQKFFAPKFVGAYSDSRYDLDGLSVELRKTAQVTEYGTRNAAVMHALLAALEFLGTIGWEKIYDRQRELSSRLIGGLQQISGVELLTATETNCYGGIVTFRVRGFSAAHISTSLLQNFKIRARAITEHHLEACRISLHIFNSPEEVDTLIGAVQAIASSVR